MKILVNVMVFGSLLLASLLSAESALAQSQVRAKAGGTEPTGEELKNSASRGISLTPVHPTIPAAPIIKLTNTKSVRTVEKTAGVIRMKPVATNHSAKRPKLQTQHAIVKGNHLPSNLAKAGSSVKMVSASSEAMLLNNSEQIVTAWLNKQGLNPAYRNREKMQINVRAHRDCNLMIFDFDGHGKLTQIFPNDYQQNSLVHAGETICIGGENSPFEYQVSIPTSQSKAKESIFVYAYPTNGTPLTVAMNHLANAPFRGTEMSIEQYRKLVNDSKVYFARGIDIIPKQGAKLTSSQSSAPSPNKIELSFSIAK